MGAAKVIGFYLSAGFTLLVAFATVWFAMLAYRRRKEKGFLWLAVAVSLQLVVTLVGRIIYSPTVIVEYPMKQWLTPIAYYTPSVAALATLVGWFLLSRKQT